MNLVCERGKKFRSSEFRSKGRKSRSKYGVCMELARSLSLLTPYIPNAYSLQMGFLVNGKNSCSNFLAISRFSFSLFQVFKFSDSQDSQDSLDFHFLTFTSSIFARFLLPTF